MSENDADRLAEALGDLPRVGLARLPTPLEPARRLTKALGGPPIYIKRDDLTGVAFGGNKVRMFEFVLGHAVAEGCEVVLAAAPVAGNYCQQLSGACARVGLRSTIIIGVDAAASADQQRVDNEAVSLARLFGATVIRAPGNAVELNAALDEAELALERSGAKVFRFQHLDAERKAVRIENYGRHAVGYCNMVLELLRQIDEAAIVIDELWVCSSEATQAGIVLANEELGRPLSVRGISPGGSPSGHGWSTEIAEIATDAARLLGLSTSIRGDQVSNAASLEAVDRAPTSDDFEAVLSVAATEGIPLDPVYTAKAIRGLASRVAREPTGSRGIVFVHTGGLASLFSYRARFDTGRDGGYLGTPD
jgi:1-aminocyclopropane-1-carboxylate deaminase/D-cysteine desulfhydrase-like pyridoxal-dependent ACC family enzyme